MNVLIIEDEPPARAKLEAMLLRLDNSVRIVGQVGSVKDTLKWLAQNHEPDLAFVDIQLSDDHSFEIFRQRPGHFPVIFTTAYDKYLLDSFEFNSIDYILKPITEQKLMRALEKVKSLQFHFQKNMLDLLTLTPPASRKDHLVARKGTEFVTLTMNEVAYFYTEHKIVFIVEFSGRRLMVDKNLGEWEERLDSRFFRLNRKYISNIKAIDCFKPDNGKIRVFLMPETREEVHVSKETAATFRKWMGGDT